MRMNIMMKVVTHLCGIYKNVNLKLENLQKLGLYNIDGVDIAEKQEKPEGNFGRAMEMCKGKNSPVGHWEIAGFVLEKAFTTYQKAFPKEMLEDFMVRTGVKGILCNEVGSGTEILKRFGEEHLETGYPIIYTSADSVFQIAAHEQIIPISKLYRICEIAREMLNDAKYNIGTVIARPFIGTKSDNFIRTYNRKDFESPNFGRTMLDVLKEEGKEVIAIGKVEDLFSGRGVTRTIRTSGNADGIQKTIEEIRKKSEGLIFTNLVDFDMLYGHRNNIKGYAEALEYFDSKLPEIVQNLKEDDMLIITADHGNDPSTPSTDHSREYIPILIYGKELKKGQNIGTRRTYADISATILESFGLQKLKFGESFYEKIKK